MHFLLFLPLLGSFFVLVFLTVSKFPLLANLDVKTIRAEQLAKKKEDLIELRLRRKFERIGGRAAGVITPVGQSIEKFFHRLYAQALALEQRYQTKARSIPSSRSLNQQNLIILLEEGADLLKQGNYAFAEKKFIQVLSLDPLNKGAYRKLGELYLDQRDFEHAIESLQHVLKIDEGDSVSYHDLGLVYQELQDYEKAVVYLKKAVEKNPNNPKYLDSLTEASILHRNKFLAQEALRQLKKANPENQKIAEFQKRIDELRM